ncbi:branched-chain amino acid transport system II carrier protein [Streptococcus massiliensis]|uniref:Branched-chain amino acid transport system carrier protein n=1 Tax=Streptococcus massiliensis TaxID=313439 RepID=A0A380KXI7_9STRE|nr:branched-chain amino acid transport system II carrier protein [Streptococcus massiliensis]SUN75854.1 putative branched-chain amino acid carrier protein [Streptococcus massiliensis]
MFKKGSLIGVLIFGFFFGAGNLIFPPALGALSGTNYLPAIAGFVLSGVGIAVLALIVGALNPKGYRYELEQKISPIFATVFLVALYLAIGPFFAIPRTASTSFDVGIKPLLPAEWAGIGLPIFTCLYFLAAYLISLNPTKVLDRIGRVLTPIFAGLIVLLVVLGISRYGSTDVQTPVAAYASNPFGTGFLEGYNTLDALASVAFSVVIVHSMRQLGFSSKKEYISIVWLVGLVVALLFSVLYLGLGFLGNHFPVPADVMSSDVNKGVYIISQATQQIFGPAGQFFLAIMVVVTCFTTTVGLIVSLSEFFHERFEWVTYKPCVTAFTLVGFAIANMGLNNIIQFSVPVLQILYPVTIVFVAILMLNKVLPLSKMGMQLTIGFVTVISLATSFAGILKWGLLTNLINTLPFAAESLPWLVPAVVGLVLSIFLPDKMTSEDADQEIFEEDTAEGHDLFDLD